MINSDTVPYSLVLTGAAWHEALDSDLPLHVSFHQDSLQHKSFPSSSQTSGMEEVLDILRAGKLEVTHVGADDDGQPLDHVHKYLALTSLETHTQTVNSWTSSSVLFPNDTTLSKYLTLFKVVIHVKEAPVLLRNILSTTKINFLCISFQQVCLPNTFAVSCFD